MILLLKARKTEFLYALFDKQIKYEESKKKSNKCIAKRGERKKENLFFVKN